MRARLFALALLAVPAIGCVADTGGDGSDPVFADDSKADGASGGVRVCATQHTGTDADGDAVAFCDKLYDTMPRVKLPEDKLAAGTAKSTLYAAIDLAGQAGVIDRSGTRYTLVDASGKAVEASKLPSALHMPSHRALYTIYKLTGVIGTYKDPYGGPDTPSLHVTSGKPIIVIGGKTIDGAYLAPTYALEGTVSRRLDASHFDSAHPVPVRITFTKLEDYANMPAWTSGTLEDGTRFKMVGTIENWSDPVKASDGTCMTSFASLGDANTWQGATDPTVRFYRFPGMHFAADEVHVLDYPVGTAGLSGNGMGGMSVTHPAALIQEHETDDWSTVGIHPHSAPNGHEMSLHPVIGGGGACD
ncbi:MAG: hypothetical protein ACM31C_17200 [Acidobacteriota bacterium]